jgi:hypothetical protein
MHTIDKIVKWKKTAESHKTVDNKNCFKKSFKYDKTHLEVKKLRRFRPQAFFSVVDKTQNCIYIVFIPIPCR